MLHLYDSFPEHTDKELQKNNLIEEQTRCQIEKDLPVFVKRNKQSNSFQEMKRLILLLLYSNQNLTDMPGFILT